jgi:hypothetical protein
LFLHPYIHEDPPAHLEIVIVLGRGRFQLWRRTVGRWRCKPRPLSAES